MILAWQRKIERILPPVETEQEGAPRGLVILGRDRLDRRLDAPCLGAGDADDLRAAGPDRAVRLIRHARFERQQDQCVEIGIESSAMARESYGVGAPTYRR